jgi:hypothetical protein
VDREFLVLASRANRDDDSLINIEPVHMVQMPRILDGCSVPRTLAFCLKKPVFQHLIFSLEGFDFLLMTVDFLRWFRLIVVLSAVNLKHSDIAGRIYRRQCSFIARSGKRDLLFSDRCR